MRTPILKAKFLTIVFCLLDQPLLGMGDQNESPDYSNLTTPAATSPSSSLLPPRISLTVGARDEYGDITRRPSIQSHSGSIASTQSNKECAKCTLVHRINRKNEDTIESLRKTLKEISNQLSESDKNQILLKANQKNLWDSSLKIGCAACVGFGLGAILATYHPDWFRFLLESRKKD